MQPLPNREVPHPNLQVEKSTKFTSRTGQQMPTPEQISAEKCPM